MNLKNRSLNCQNLLLVIALGIAFIINIMLLFYRASPVNAESEDEGDGEGEEADEEAGNEEDDETDETDEASGKYFQEEIQFQNFQFIASASDF